MAPAVLGESSVTPCDVKALQACLEQNGGDRSKCQRELAAFQSACGRPREPPHKPQ